jgi:UDP-glucose 4-epimerase
MHRRVDHPKRILVTGGRGRLASLIADHYRAPEHTTTLYSRSAGPGFVALSQLLDPTHLAGANALLHLAWSTLPATAEQSPASDSQQDLALLEKLLSALAAVPAAARPLFVFFSSGGAVYGNAPGRPSREDDPCQPIGRYGASKLAAEQLINAAAAHHGLACAILRIANPYGYPVPSGRVQGVIPHAIRAAAEGRPLTLWGDGQARKDFLYYTDFLSALQMVTDRRLTGTYNICSGESHSVREIIALVERHTGRTVAATTTPAPAWDVRDSRLDPAKFIAATDWQPQVSLDEGVRRSASGFFDHV